VNVAYIYVVTSHFMRTLLSISFFFCLTSCYEQNSEHKAEDTSKKIDTNLHSINAFGSVSGDTSKFIKLTCGLYINEKGTLAYKAVDNSYRMDTTGNSKPLDVYLTTIYYADQSDSINGGLKEMKYVVDTASFKILGSFYFKDKNHVYDFNPMSDGGTIGINWDADVKTFQVLESSFYSKDRKHCYYRGNIIEGADINSFKVLDTSYSWHIAYDKRNYYSSEKKLNLVGIKEQNLDSVRRKKNGL
jgi:DKNYY family